MSTVFIVSSDVPDAGGDDGIIGDLQPAGIYRAKFQEKRSSSRFPVHQEIQYRAIDQREDKSIGAGLTLDMSGSGIRFSIQERIPLGCVLEASVDWPVRLDGTCPLKVVLVGRVVRSEADWAALSILRYEFRTKGSGLAQSVAAPQAGAGTKRRRTRIPRYRTVRARATNETTESGATYHQI